MLELIKHECLRIVCNLVPFSLTTKTFTLSQNLLVLVHTTGECYVSFKGILLRFHVFLFHEVILKMELFCVTPHSVQCTLWTAGISVHSQIL